MRRFLNPPNLVSLARILLIPFVVVSLVERNHRAALALVGMAGGTDALDGFLARRFGWMTSAGALLDPIADKLLLTAIYVALGCTGLVPVWLVGIVVGRDLLILLVAGAAILFTGHRKFPPSVWGKGSTIIQVTAALVIIAGQALPSTGMARLKEWFVWVTAAATVASGVHYGWRSRGLIHRSAGVT